MIPTLKTMFASRYGELSASDIFHMGLKDYETGGIVTEQLFYPSHLLLLSVGSGGVGRNGAVSGQ